ncbi:MAG TPA: hypothetical protein VFX06_11130 [Stellaceae bacterium]|jgi:hypothetical protein|nr:hypothetical protein [Stellaceae bacterium]
MNYLAAAAAVALFAWGLKRVHAVETAAGAIALARRATAILLDASLSDDEKERAARASSLRLLRDAARLLGSLGLAAAVSLGFLALLVWARLVTVAALADAAESWVFLAAATLVAGIALFWRR